MEGTQRGQSGGLGLSLSKTHECGTPPNHPKFTVNKEEPSPAATFPLWSLFPGVALEVEGEDGFGGARSPAALWALSPLLAPPHPSQQQ